VNLPPEILDVLETAPLFRGVPSKLFAHNLNELNLRALKTGEVLLEPGEPNNEVYIVLSGRLNIQFASNDPQPILMLGKGESTGEMSVLGDAHDSTFVVAATDCKLLAIGHSVLWELIDISHQAAHNVLNVLSTRIRPNNGDITENLEHHHGFSGAAVIDDLTGLYNRKWVEEKFNRHLNRDILNKKASCIMVLQIDNFKEFTDKYGQLGSEQALRDTAHNMLSCLRPDDQAGHFVDEQFAVFMPNTMLSDGCIAAERLRVSVAGSMIMLPNGDALPPVSLSLGVGQASADDTLADLFAHANEALQVAVKSGGNCVRWYEQNKKSNFVESAENVVVPENAKASADANIVLPEKPFMALWPDACDDKK
jgi:diguanylate cyclase (GGDEF)-like protein